MISRNDNKLYGGAGRFIYSLDENSGQTFAPATSATYTWTQQALDLPSNYKIKCMEELGNNLMSGTWMSSGEANLKVADIFPWDRNSPSFLEPLKLNENGVHAMLNINNILYILAGITGKVFSSNGVQVAPLAQIPTYVTDYESIGYYLFYPGAIMNHKGRLFFGIGNDSTGGIMGVFSLNGNLLNLENLISTGNDGSTSSIQIGALLSTGYVSYLIGWKDGTSYGIDSILYRYTGYGAYAESPLYPVGTPLAKRGFSQLEFQLVRPLATGQGIKIKYRTNLTDSFTELGTYIYSGTVTSTTKVIGARTSFNDTAKIPDCEFIQIRVELTTGENSNTTPELKTIILR
jgi:hypothetical protein